MKLDAPTLELAYRHGYFPMADDQGEIGWYRPDPRAIIPLDGFHTSRSLRRTLRKDHFQITFDQCFEQIMRLCGDRPEGTWMTEQFIIAYGELYRTECAHSVEVWFESELVGGLYGVSLGGAFFAESKFHRMRDASKVALYRLIEKLSGGGYQLLEVQFLTPHLQSLGAIEVPGEQYDRLLARALEADARF